MKIHYLPANIDGQGCYRCIFPAAYLSERGHEAGMPAFVLHDGNGNLVPPLPGAGILSVPPGDFLFSFLEDSMPLDADVYVVQTGMAQMQHDQVAKFREQNPAARFVLELDDYLHDIPAYNPAKLAGHQNRDMNRRKAVQVAEQVDAITCSTPQIARYWSRFNENVTVVPNYLHWPMWAQTAPVYEREDWQRFRIGYMGSSAFHSEDLKQWAPVLQAWLQKHPDVEFVAAGDPRLHKIVGTPRGQRVTTAKVWFRNLDLAQITSTFDVGLVPLVRNDFNEAKSCLKGMEYGACGIPCIATPTEEYRRYVRDGDTGFLASKPSDVTALLDLLYNDRGLLRELGKAAHEHARAHSLDRHIGEWEAVFDATIRGGHADGVRGSRPDRKSVV